MLSCLGCSCTEWHPTAGLRPPIGAVYAPLAQLAERSAARVLALAQAAAPLQCLKLIKAARCSLPASGRFMPADGAST